MTKTTHQPMAPETGRDVDEFLVEHHEEIAAKLEEARAEIARGEVAALEPLADLLEAARIRAAR